jgi:hypothetical protein
MFKFNFSCPEIQNNSLNTNELTASKDLGTLNGSFGILDIDEINIPNLDDILNDNKNFNKFYINDNEYIEYFQLNKNNEILLEKLNKSLSEINKTCDIIKGIYEGGLKSWECSFDLAKYMHSNIDQMTKDKKKLQILELGCGQALPILAFLKTKASNFIDTIYLQDFNVECLKIQTFINIKKNVIDTNKFKIKFVYGSWDMIFKNKILPIDYFDLIFSSETIYNPSYYRNLLDIFKYTLKSESSECYVLLAVKSYYFGCGGNLHEFVELAESKEYNFMCSNNLLEIDNKNKCIASMSENKLQTITKEIIKIRNRFKN